MLRGLLAVQIFVQKVLPNRWASRSPITSSPPVFAANFPPGSPKSAPEKRNVQFYILNQMTLHGRLFAKSALQGSPSASQRSPRGPPKTPKDPPRVPLSKDPPGVTKALQKSPESLQRTIEGDTEGTASHPRIPEDPLGLPRETPELAQDPPRALVPKVPKAMPKRAQKQPRDTRSNPKRTSSHKIKRKRARQHQRQRATTTTTIPTTTKTTTKIL